MKKKKRSLAVLLSLSMVMSTFYGITVQAEENEPVTTNFQFIEYGGYETGTATYPTPDQQLVDAKGDLWISALKDGGSSSYIAISDVYQRSEEDGSGFGVVTDSAFKVADFDLYLMDGWSDVNDNEDYEGKQVADEDKAKYMTDGTEGKVGLIECHFPADAIGEYQLVSKKEGSVGNTLTLQVNYAGDVELFTKSEPTEEARYDGNRLTPPGSTLYVAQFDTQAVTFTDPKVWVKIGDEDYTDAAETVAQCVSLNSDTAVAGGVFAYTEAGRVVTSCALNAELGEDAHTWQTYALTIKEGCPRDFELKVEYTAQEKDSEGTYTRSFTQYIRTKGEAGFFKTVSDAQHHLNREENDENDYSIDHFEYLDEGDNTFYYAVEGTNSYTFKVYDAFTDETTEVALLGDNTYCTVSQEADTDNLSIYKLALTSYVTTENQEKGHCELEIQVYDGEDQIRSIYIAWDDGDNEFVYASDGNKTGQDAGISPVTTNKTVDYIMIADFDPDTREITKTYTKTDIKASKVVCKWNEETKQDDEKLVDCTAEVQGYMTNEADGRIACRFPSTATGEYRLYTDGMTDKQGLWLYVHYPMDNADLCVVSESGKLVPLENSLAVGGRFYLAALSENEDEKARYEIEDAKVTIRPAESGEWLTSQADVTKYVTYAKTVTEGYPSYAFTIVDTCDSAFNIRIDYKIRDTKEGEEDSWIATIEREIGFAYTGLVLASPNKEIQVDDHKDWHGYDDAGELWPSKKFTEDHSYQKYHWLLGTMDREGVFEPLNVGAEDLSFKNEKGQGSIQKCQHGEAGCYEFSILGAGTYTLSYGNESVKVVVRDSRIKLYTRIDSNNKPVASSRIYESGVYDPDSDCLTYDCWKNGNFTLYISIEPYDGEKLIDFTDKDGNSIGKLIWDNIERVGWSKITENELYKITVPRGESFDEWLGLRIRYEREIGGDFEDWRWINLRNEGMPRPALEYGTEGMNYSAVLMTESEYDDVTTLWDPVFTDDAVPFLWFNATTVQELVNLANTDGVLTFHDSNGTNRTVNVKQLRKQYGLDYLKIGFSSKDSAKLSEKEECIKTAGNLKGIIIDANGQLQRINGWKNYGEVFIYTKEKAQDWLNNSLKYEQTDYDYIGVVFSEDNEEEFDVYKVTEASGKDYNFDLGARILAHQPRSTWADWTSKKDALCVDTTAPVYNINADTDYKVYGDLSDIQFGLSKDSDHTITVCDWSWGSEGPECIGRTPYGKSDIPENPGKTTITINDLSYDNGLDFGKWPNEFNITLYLQKTEVEASGNLSEAGGSVEVTADTAPDITTDETIVMSDKQMESMAKSGASIVVDMKVDTVDADTTTSAAIKTDVAKIDQQVNALVAGTETVVSREGIQILDINMSAKIEKDKEGGQDGEKEIVPFDGETNKNVKDDGSIAIKETKKPVEIKLVLPMFTSQGLGFLVIRVHEGQVEFITPKSIDRNSGTLIFETDRFSTYGVVPVNLKEVDDAVLDNLIASANATVAKYDNTDISKFSYDGTTKTFKIAGEDIPKGMVVSYCAIEDSVLSANTAGAFTAKVKFLLDNNYYDTSDLERLSTKVTDLQKERTIRWSIEGKADVNTALAVFGGIDGVMDNFAWDYTEDIPYDGQMHTVALKKKVNDNLPDGISIQYSGVCKASAAGTYTAKAKLVYSKDKYYALSSADELKLYADSLQWTIKSSGGNQGGSTVDSGNGSPIISGGAGQPTTKPEEGTVIETKPDGTVVETKTEVAKDGTVTKTEVATKTDGSKTETTTITSADGKKSTALEVAFDSKGEETSSELEMSQVSGSKRNVFSVSSVNEMLAATKTDTVVTFVAKTTAGNVRYRVTVAESDLNAKTSLVAYRLMSKGELVMVDRKDNTAKVTAAGNLITSMSEKCNYKLVDKKEAAKIDKKILATVKVAKASASIKPSKSTTFKFSSKLNKKNVLSIVYKSSDTKKVKVSKTGTIKGLKKGTATIKATVTLKNGAKKTVKMTIKVK